MQEFISYLSKFEFTFIFFSISVIFMFCSYFFKKIKNINLVFFGVFLALTIFEAITCITNTPILIKGKCEYIYRNLDNLKLRTIRHLSILPDDQFFLDDFDKSIDNLIKDKSKIVFDTRFQVYDNSFKYTKGNRDSDTSIIFLGCSNTFGAGLNGDQTLPYYFSEKYNFNINVLNCAISGMGINTAYSIINSDILRNPLLVNKNSHIKYFIYIAIGDHVERAFRTSGFNLADDNFILENGKFVRAKEPLGFLKVIFNKSYIFNKYIINIINAKNRKFHEQYFIYRIMKMKDLVSNKYNTELIVVLWPDMEKQIIETLQRNNINLIVLDRKFIEKEEYKIKNDGHPNEKANKEIAQILFDYINNKS